MPVQLNFRSLVDLAHTVFLTLFKDSEVKQIFFEDFDGLDNLHVIGNRVQNQHFQMVHRQSGIVCSLHIGHYTEMEKSTSVIRDYMALNPICKLN